MIFFLAAPRQTLNLVYTVVVKIIPWKTTWKTSAVHAICLSWVMCGFLTFLWRANHSNGFSHSVQKSAPKNIFPAGHSGLPIPSVFERFSGVPQSVSSENWKYPAFFPAFFGVFSGWERELASERFSNASLKIWVPRVRFKMKASLGNFHLWLSFAQFQHESLYIITVDTTPSATYCRTKRTRSNRLKFRLAFFVITKRITK